MKTKFLLLILNAPNTKFYTRDKIHERAKDLGYTMFAFNGYIYSVSDGEKIFELKDIIELQ